jgi:hypothetical protein
MNSNKFYTQVLIVSFLFFASCGRKQKNIFSFEPDPKIKATKLDLPAVTGLSITKNDGCVILTWFDLFNQKNNAQIKALQKNFIGYDVFKLTKQNFIPKHTLNKTPLTETRFVDKTRRPPGKTPKKSFYLIQPVFKFDNQLIKGLSSQIVSIEN